MTQNPKELAKQGDPQAIAAFVNRSLKAKGIDAEVTRDGGYLRVMLTCAQVPPQEALVAFIRNGMTSLSVRSIHTVQVSGYHKGDDFPVWEEEIELLPPHDDMLFDDDDDEILPSQGVQDDETLETYSKSGEYVASPEDEDMDPQYEDENEVESSPPPKKGGLPLLPIAVIIAVLALVGGGLFAFKDKIPFLSSQTTPVVEGSPSPEASETPEASPSVSPSETPKPTTSPGTAKTPTPKPTTSPGTAKTPTPKPTTSPAPKPPVNPWREGVNKAQQAANLAQQAKTPQQWTQVANTWQQAITAMKKVPATDPNYAVAQKKAVDYQTNLAYAKRNAGL